MRKWIVIAALTLFTVFAGVNLVRDFKSNDPVHYFAQQPSRLLVVAAIAVGGGLVMLIFYRLSPRWQRAVKLFAIGSAATCLTVCTGYMIYGLADLSLHLGVPPGPKLTIGGVAWPCCAAAFLWLEFYRLSKTRGLSK